MKTKKALFAAGCFWHVQEAFDKTKGVVKTQAGYAGGTKENLGYEEVSTGKTGHVEAVEVEYNPEEVSYEELLNKFWKMHNPTQKNRQGVDIGNQYQAVIFYYDEEHNENTPLGWAQSLYIVAAN